MNRIIKYRAWNESKNSFVPYQFVGTPEKGWSAIDSDSGEGVALMQFTGLLDKTGKEIYEGDVVNGYWRAGETDWGDQLGDSFTKRQVVFHESLGAFGFPVRNNGEPKKPLENYINTMAQCSDFEIIGNIHENPDLLNQ